MCKREKLEDVFMMGKYILLILLVHKQLFSKNFLMVGYKRIYL